MRKLFTAVLCIGALVACRNQSTESESSVTPVVIGEAGFLASAAADGITTYSAEFELPAAWRELEGYDKLLVEFGAVDSPDFTMVNGVCVGKKGFFPENGICAGDANDRVDGCDRNYYLPMDSPFLVWGGKNTVEIRITEGTSMCFPVKVVPVRASLPAVQGPELMYAQMMRKFRKGWNTWDTRSVFTQLYLPEGFAVKVALIDPKGEVRDDIRVGNQDYDAAVVHPYDHTYDGTYSEVDAFWHGMSVKQRSSACGDDLVMVITPGEGIPAGSRLRINPEAAWDMLSDVSNWAERVHYQSDGRFMYHRSDWSVTLDGRICASDLKQVEDDVYTCSALSPVVITVGKRYCLEEAEKMLSSVKEEINREDKVRFGDKYEAYHSMQSILAWDTVYDPGDEVVVTPVSKNWNLRFGAVRDFGGYVIFDWDTFFASQMLSTGCRELSYANAVEVCRSVDQLGFVPKSRCDHNSMTEDTSQPPVGSMNVWKIYERYGEKWFLELVYDRLLAWNRWWPAARQTDGLLCWGSNPVRIRSGERSSGMKNQAVLESGLDNSQMYDDVRYNPETYQLAQQDVGLTSMYVMDCEYLTRIAEELGHTDDAREVSGRGDFFRNNIGRFWCEEDGMFYNINTDTGEFNKRTSPTNFYVLLAHAATTEQARRLVEEHLLNENEYWGEWVIPNAARNDPAYEEQDYWRGRIWGPTNFLVYLGLCNYDFPQVRNAFSDKGEKLLMKDWLDKGYIYENWNAITGDGGDRSNCDAFYHWGALLSYIALLDSGKL